MSRDPFWVAFTVLCVAVAVLAVEVIVFAVVVATR